MDCDENKIAKAKAFLKKADESSSYEQRLLCTFNGFVCLFGPSNAISRTGLNQSDLRLALEYAAGDNDCPRHMISEEDLLSMRQKLVSEISLLLNPELKFQSD
jgi:hypothetical protein